MAEDVWPDEPQAGSWDSATRDKYPPAAPSASTTVAPEAGDGRVPIGRGAGLVATGALGVPGDIIQSTQPAISWAANKLGVPDTGPQIPIPTTEYIRNRFGMAPPSGEAENALDTTGKAVGGAASALAIPGARGSAMLSAGVGSVASALSEHYFPDSVALQLLAGGLSGLTTTGVARRLLTGGMRGVGQSAIDIANVMGREYIGSAIGAGLAHITGIPEVLAQSLGGFAGLMSHRLGRGIASSVFTRPGVRGTIAGTLGAIPEALQTYSGMNRWPDEPQGSNPLILPP